MNLIILISIYDFISWPHLFILNPELAFILTR